MKRPKILITGGLGFIGSHTCVLLYEHGFEPIIVDDLSNSSMSVLDGIEAITGKRFSMYTNNICSKNTFEKIYNEHPDIVGVIHFAAFKAVGESVDKPLKYYNNNLVGLLRVLDYIQSHKINKFVFSSSCTVYGETDNSPISENAPIVKASSPYGNTKQIGEEIINDFCKANQKSAISLRYFNPIGAHPSALIGELPIGVPNNLVPYITQTAAGIRDELIVFGNSYNTPDGTCIRDYIHVMDLALAHVKALDIKGKGMSVFNVGTGNGNSVMEVIKCFEKVSKVKLNYKFGPKRAGDVEKIWANTSKVKRHLNWSPKYSLDDMMKHSWAWQKKLLKKKKLIVKVLFLIFF